MERNKQKVKRIKDKAIHWVKKNRAEAIFLLGIIILAVILRFWRIDEYLPFMGDEGRDVRVVSRFLKDFDLMFIGPRTSIGNMYLGPLYYYLISPFLFFWQFSPVGPAVFVALLGVITVSFIWYVGREWFGVVAGLTSALLFSVSPIVINLSKHSWNPNIMPFFALLSIFSIWRVWKKKQFKWMIILGISLAFVAQSHYLGLLLLPAIGLFWLLTFVKHRNKKFTTFSILGLLLFFFLMSPLAFFDAKHGWQNFGAIKTFFTDRQTTVSAKPWSSIPQTWPIWNEKFITRVVAADSKSIGVLVSILIIAGVFGYQMKKEKSHAFYLLVIWILVGIGGLGLYKQSIYDHYFGFLFPAPFLLIGALVQELRRNKKFGWVAFIAIAAVFWINISNNPLKHSPQRQLQRTQDIDKKIIDESGGKPFNFGLIAKRNYEESYLYFFELWKSQIREIDAQKSEETITDQLFVVCEDLICEPINNPKAEIANFGWGKIENEWEVSGLKLFKLLHKN